MKIAFELEALSDLSQVVLESPNPSEFASHLALKTLSALDCRGVIVGLIRQAGFLDLIGSFGFKESATEPFHSMPIWTPLPITDCARTGKISIFNNSAEMLNAYPALSGVELAESNATVSIPISKRNSVIGAVGFTSRLEPASDFVESHFLAGIMSLTGIFLERFQLVESSSTRKIRNGNSNSKLSTRQIEIIQNFESGLTINQLSRKFRLSESTIKQDIIRIYDFFGSNSREEIVKLFRNSGIG